MFIVSYISYVIHMLLPPSHPCTLFFRPLLSDLLESVEKSAAGSTDKQPGNLPHDRGMTQVVSSSCHDVTIMALLNAMESHHVVRKAYL